MAPVQTYEPGVTHQLTRHETLCAALERGHPLSAAHTDRLDHTSANSELADERFRAIRRPHDIRRGQEQLIFVRQIGQMTVSCRRYSSFPLLRHTGPAARTVALTDLRPKLLLSDRQ